MIIYKIQNKINDKIYIGQTKRDLSQRIAGHIKNDSHIGRALRKYGLESFIISVIDHADIKEILDEKERYWIKSLDSRDPNGYNLTDGGDGLINPSEETKKKMSNSQKGKVHSRERIEKGRQSHIGKKYNVSQENREKLIKRNKERVWTEESRLKYANSIKGKTLGRKDSEETIIKKSIAAKNRKPHIVTNETRQKMSLTRIGHVVLDETREKIRVSNTGKKASEETREKLRERWVERKATHSIAAPVCQIEDFKNARMEGA